MQTIPGSLSQQPQARRVSRLLFIAGTALLVVFVAVVLASLIQTRSIGTSLETIRTRHRPRAEAAYEIEINLFEVANTVLSAARRPDSATLRVFHDERRQLDSAVARYLRLGPPGDTADRRMSLALTELVARHDSAANSILGDSSLEGAARAGALRRYRSVQTQLASLLDREVQPGAIETWHKEADRVLAVSRRELTIIVLVAILGALIAAYFGVLTARANRQTENARARAELASRQKTEFASITAHELRSPLNAILGSIRLMASGRVGQMPHTAHPHLDMASRNSARLMTLIDELLELDKLEAGMLPLEQAEVVLAEVVHTACASLDSTAEELGVTVRTELESHGNVVGDPGRLRQVVVNLVSNGLKHAPRGTELVARVEDRNGAVRVTVMDRGPGIAPQDRERIFQRFVQTASAPKQHSTGLGLTIARELVIRHGGRIGVESEPGKGASFWFEMPAAIGRAAHAVAAPLRSADIGPA